ncbi:hypothetical protein [Streptomyces sp. NPDC060188]|uniref:hypothetical protein n=1 Tax=Streptomyces sp. NPDC060188 TaxID=3347068 RepID=UPI00364A221A
MSPEQVDAYRNAGHTIHPAVDWFINLVATYGIWAVIAVGTLAILAVWLLIGILLDRHERRAAQRADQRSASSQEDLATCQAIWNTPSTQPRKETP